MPERQEDPQVPQVPGPEDKPAEQKCPIDLAIKAGLSKDELLVMLARGYLKPAAQDAELTFDGEKAVGVNDAGETITLGEVEAAIVKRVEEAIADGTIPRNFGQSQGLQ